MATQACAAFCDLPSPTAAVPYDVHGPYCVSKPCGRAIDVTVDGVAAEVTVDVVRPWDRTDARAAVRVIWETAAGCRRTADVDIDSAEARTLAAELLAAAAIADELPHIVEAFRD